MSDRYTLTVWPDYLSGWRITKAGNYYHVVNREGLVLATLPGPDDPLDKKGHWRAELMARFMVNALEMARVIDGLAERTVTRQPIDIGEALGMIERLRRSSDFEDDDS